MDSLIESRDKERDFDDDLPNFEALDSLGVVFVLSLETAELRRTGAFWIDPKGAGEVPLPEPLPLDLPVDAELV